MRAPAPPEEIVMKIDLEQARRRAKELLRAAHAGDHDALARMRDDRPPRLADAQRAIATELGFPSWPALVDHERATVGDRGERRARLVSAALDGRADVAEQLLARDPALADAGLDVAFVLGDPEQVAAALERDPALVARELPGVGRRPLSCACHSVFLRPSSPRAPGLRRVVKLLLDHGADVNEVHHNEYGAMSVLYGAAGVAHDPETTRLLLERGADPNGLTPYARAARFKSEETMRLLEAAGAPTDLDPAADWIGAIVRGDRDRAAHVKAEHPDLVLRGRRPRAASPVGERR
jgi:hypothetical protein